MSTPPPLPLSTLRSRCRTRKVVSSEFGISRDPLEALTSVPRAAFRWVWRYGFPARFFSRGWAPVPQTDRDNGDHAPSPEEGRPREGGVGVEGGAADFEPLGAEGEGEREGVVINRLRKEFDGKVAVAGLDLRLRVGDITCLLGHNGAGEVESFSAALLLGVEHLRDVDCMLGLKYLASQRSSFLSFR